MNIQANSGGFVRKKNFSSITFYRCTVLCRALPCIVCMSLLVHFQRCIQRLIFRLVLNCARYFSFPYKRKSKRKEMSVVRAVLAPLSQFSVLIICKNMKWCNCFLHYLNSAPFVIFGGCDRTASESRRPSPFIITYFIPSLSLCVCVCVIIPIHHDFFMILLWVLLICSLVSFLPSFVRVALFTLIPTWDSSFTNGQHTFISVTHSHAEIHSATRARAHNIHFHKSNASIYHFDALMIY